MKTFSLAAAAALSLSASAALAQNVNANNLVNVNVSHIAVDLADLLDVTVQDIQALAVVQVPIGIAANVCGVAANVLAQDNKSGDAACDAETTSNALTRAVASQM